MCDPVSGTMAALSAVGGMVDIKNQNAAWAAQETARRKQKIEMVRQANSQDAQLRLQAHNSFIQSRDALEQESIGYIQAKGAVETAIGESNLEGRTMDRVRRDVDQKFLQTKTRIQSNYETDYGNIWAERESVRDNLISGLEGMPAQKKPSKLGQAIGLATNTMSGYKAGSDLKGIMKNDANLQDWF
ncbi:MAG: virion core protein, T7 gp14 family [Cetobacterium sp.]|uniref:virion core protein, T7 gp14 family n=1 Tax=Cetobacterium sp. TaxID=2071632 RepID=UPI003EE5D79E